MTDKRPVWLDESDLHVLRSAAQHLPGTLEQEALTRIADAWDAAPADPVEAIGKWIEWEANIPAVLRALGMPHA